jgi:hypothetical protein
VQRVCAVLIRVRECWGKQPCRECTQPQMRVLRRSLGLDHPSMPLDLVTKDRSPQRSTARQKTAPLSKFQVFAQTWHA